MPEACDAVAECCADDGSTTSGDFDSCMGGKGLTPPDFASLVPGGLPEELGGEPAAAGTDATEAPPAEEEETETTTVPATEAPVPPAATGGGAGRSAGAALAASALVAVACSALVRV